MSGSATNPEAETALATLETRLRTILPEQYLDGREDVQPVSMGSAGLKFSPDGRVAWNEIWASFCHLAMAGGPPHKGTLLEPGTAAEIRANPGRYRQVVDEICRGIALVTGLDAEPAKLAGWVRVECSGPAMAGWLARAIVMENVSARCEGAVLLLPAGPAYRLEKEIKNVVTVIAKTCHYWRDHMPPMRQQAIGDLFEAMELESPLIQPALAGLEISSHQGWLGFECQTVPAAIWMMRALVVSNVLARREGTVLFVPVDPATDPDGRTVARRVSQMHRVAAAQGQKHIPPG